MSAWIETLHLGPSFSGSFCRTLMSAWIETSEPPLFYSEPLVALS